MFVKYDKKLTAAVCRCYPAPFIEAAVKAWNVDARHTWAIFHNAFLNTKGTEAFVDGAKHPTQKMAQALAAAIKAYKHHMLLPELAMDALYRQLQQDTSVPRPPSNSPKVLVPRNFYNEMPAHMHVELDRMNMRAADAPPALLVADDAELPVYSVLQQIETIYRAQQRKHNRSWPEVMKDLAFYYPVRKN